MPVVKIKSDKRKPVQTAQNGYTPQSAEASAKRNCKAVGGTWDKKAGKCVGGEA